MAAFVFPIESFTFRCKNVPDDIQERMATEITKLSRIIKAPKARWTAFKPDVMLTTINHANHWCIFANGAIDSINCVACCSYCRISSIYYFRLRYKLFFFMKIEP